MPKKKTIDYAALYTLRKDGRYMGYWRDRNGKRHAIYDRDPQALYERIAELEGKRDAPLTFGEIAEAWKTTHWARIAVGTQKCYQSAYKRAVDRIGTAVASEIRPTDIQAHLELLKKQDYSAKVIKTQRTVYHLIFSYAILDPDFCEEVRSNPASFVTIPKGVKRAKKRDAPPDSVIRQIRDRADAAYFGLFCLLLISTGLRRGEALALQWSDIDLSKKTISISKALHYDGVATIGATKTESGIRTVPILPDLLPCLEKAQKKAHSSQDYLFHGDAPNKPMPENSFQRHWTHYCKDMGFVTDCPETRISKQGRRYTYHKYKPTYTPHFMRHGYATMLYEAGVDAYTAQKLLGHANIQTTLAIYTHLKQERETASIDSLTQFVQKSISSSGSK